MNCSSLPSNSVESALDLLLDRVRRQEVSLQEVALAPFIAHLLEEMQSVVAQHSAQNSDWILLAATLIHWKTLSLLAPAAAPSTSDPTHEERLCVLLGQYQEIAAELEDRYAANIELVSKTDHSHSENEVEPRADQAWVSVWDLSRQARELSAWATRRSQQRQIWKQEMSIATDECTVADSIDYLQERMAEQDGSFDSTILFTEQPCSLGRISLLLAILEVANRAQLQVHQNMEFGPLWLTSLPSSRG